MSEKHEQPDESDVGDVDNESAEVKREDVPQRPTVPPQKASKKRTKTGCISKLWNTIRGLADQISLQKTSHKVWRRATRMRAASSTLYDTYSESDMQELHQEQARLWRVHSTRGLQTAERRCTDARK